MCRAELLGQAEIGPHSPLGVYCGQHILNRENVFCAIDENRHTLALYAFEYNIIVIREAKNERRFSTLCIEHATAFLW